MPGTFWFVMVLSIVTWLTLHLEWRQHRRALSRVPIRIFVNGTRGKSSVTRLIAAVLRDNGIRTVAKTTGTSARLILQDGHETPVPRDGPPNIAELVRTLRTAARLGAEAIVFECMAVDPDLQRIAEERIMQPTITVVTNARLDHTDVQGASVTDIAKAFAVRPGGTLVTADPIVAQAHAHRLGASGGRALVSEAESVDSAELHGMSYVEHPENVALVLEVARVLGIGRERALQGLIGARPDPGAACLIHLWHPSGPWRLVNLFAANDPESTFQALETVETAFGRFDRPILLFAARGDRTARSAEFAKILVAHRQRFHKVIQYGERTRAMTRKARRGGIAEGWLIDAGNRSPASLTDLLLSCMDGERTVVGVGNIIGPAQRWLEYLAETASPETSEDACDDEELKEAAV